MHDKNDSHKNKYWERKVKTRSGLFAITPIILDMIIIAALLGGYYYILTHSLFPEWIDYIYWGVKFIIAFQILAASARSLFAPILTAAAGAFLLYAVQIYDLTLFTTADGWQLIAVSLIGFLVTIVVKL